MIVDSRTSQWQKRACFFALAAFVLVATGGALAQDEAKKDRKLPKGVTALTKEHLRSKVPSFFYFDYDGDPLPGKRLWLRVDDGHWVERYPDGSEAKFRILGSTTANGKKGTLAVKTMGDVERTGTENDGAFQVFIPDKGTGDMRFMFRNGDSDWGELADMKKVE